MLVDTANSFPWIGLEIWPFSSNIAKHDDRCDMVDKTYSIRSVSCSFQYAIVIPLRMYQYRLHW